MSDIILMNQTDGEYQCGQVYRVRSRNAQEFVEADIASIEPYTKLEFDSTDPVDHEGV